MLRRKRLVLAIILALMGGLLGNEIAKSSNWYHELHSKLGISTARTNLLVLYELLNIGDTEGEVLKIFDRNGMSALKLSKWKSDQWVIATPLQLMADNWILLLDFENNRVVQIRIRTDDSINEKPASSPPDRTGKTHSAKSGLSQR